MDLGKNVYLCLASLLFLGLIYGTAFYALNFSGGEVEQFQAKVFEVQYNENADVTIVRAIGYGKLKLLGDYSDDIQEGKLYEFKLRALWHRTKQPLLIEELS